MKLKDIPLDKIKLVEGVQQRTKLDEAHVAELAEAVTEGAALPPMRVFFDGTDYILSRGFHRLPAYKRVQFASAPCEVMQGGVREAILDACGDNADHGLKRTNADKRKAVETLLKDKKWGTESDRWIGEKAKVDHKTVAKIRSELVEGGQLGKSPVRVGKDGKNRSVPPKDLAGANAAPADGPCWVETDQDKEPVLTDEDWAEADKTGKAKAYLKAAEKSLGALQDNCANAVRQGAKFDLAVVEKSCRAIYTVIEQGRKSL